jgi:hypothetical protein
MKYKYLEPHYIKHNGAYVHRVLTPDGGVIQCCTEADARRVASDMNMLCERIIEGCEGGIEPQELTIVLDAYEKQ